MEAHRSVILELNFNCYLISQPTYYNNLHSEWPFNISRLYDDSNVYRWREPRPLKKPDPDGIGENGTAFVPPDANAKETMDNLLQVHNYNLIASEMISLYRSLPDARSDECRRLSYPSKLPTASVIIIFHNEGWSTLLRTVWSVINRSPRELIKEIILVDDCSTWEFLNRPLDDYVELLPVKIKVIRSAKRVGLIRARLIGAKYATGNVLTFLDAHVECNEGWLQPLLSRIANDRSVIVVPLIDTISSADFSYQYGKTITVTGFRWTLIYNWYAYAVPDRELVRTHNDVTATIQTPTMIGCGFAIDREFFFEVGAFDEGMDIWGSENMEISLRVWQCGGSVNIVPCSHIGHLFRVSTYSFDGDVDEIKSRNNMRMVEVWMSDLKHLHYAARPPQKNVQPGDLTERINIKSRLKCKNFRWYLDNVYPESNMGKDFVYLGEIKNHRSGLCLDINVGDIQSPLTMSGCHKQGGNQFFALTEDRMIVTSQEFCVGANDEHYAVISVKDCNDPLQSWHFYRQEKWLQHISSGLCMMANESAVILVKCDPHNVNLVWDINL
ncbi:hypothetical protein HA402_009682 [Bradysia odoriphaga]|nr:hypothetical protein HA402_009682 [Bradysia odoriphaga]